jgi:hypothetical protein
VATLPHAVPRHRRRFSLDPLGAECDAPTGTARPEDEGEGSALACAGYRQTITTAVVRTSVGAAHEHSFANPAGFKFHSAASRATGCATLGPPSTYWSWFAS